MGVFVTLRLVFVHSLFFFSGRPSWKILQHNYWWNLKVQKHATASDVPPDLISIGCHKSLKTSFIVAFSCRTMCWCSAKRVRYPEKKNTSAFLLPLSFLLLSPLPASFFLSFPLTSSVEMKDRHWGSGGQALAQLSNHHHSSFFSSPALTGHLSTGCWLWPLH